MSSRDELAEALRAAAKKADETPCDMDCDPVDCPSCGLPVQAFSFINGRPETVFGEPEALVDVLMPLIDDRCPLQQRGDLMETDWRGRNVRIFPGWDVLRRAPFVEGHVVSLRPAMWVVRDADGVEQEWPVTLPIEEA